METLPESRRQTAVGYGSLAAPDGCPPPLPLSCCKNAASRALLYYGIRVGGSFFKLGDVPLMASKNNLSQPRC